jgi:hypothetical protein
MPSPAKTPLIALLCCSAAALAPSQAAAQGRPDTQALLGVQREAMRPLSFVEGVWRGKASTLRDGKWHNITQTERMGPMLDGTVKVIEGRGYEADGRTSFNALGIISYNPMTKAYSIRSYAMGLAGDFTVTPRKDGFVWETPAGRGAIIRFTATVQDGTWHEVGERIAGDAPPVKTFEMRLRRLGPTTWPLGTPVPAR